jgi:RimJ/RimL family protein N-acetyltransferase
MADIPQLETERLLLRNFREDDAAALMNIFGDDQVTRFYDIATFTHIEQAHRMVARLLKRNADGNTMRWGITLKENGQLIGTGGFNEFKGPRAGIGYDLATAYWKRGYVTEAVRAIVAHGFATLNLNRIEAFVMPENAASARVLEKLGFTREGLLREYGFWKNQSHDLQMFALLQRDWKGT